MGKIIVNNIKVMGWKTRIGLIAMFTLVFSVLIYQGWNQHRSAQAQVATGTAWQSVYAATGGNLARRGDLTVTSSGYTAAAGVNRILLVSVAYEFATATSADNGITVTFGGVTVNQIATTNVNRGTDMLGHVWIGYIAGANIPAASSTVTATFARAAVATTVSAVSIKVGTYTGVDQASPIAGSNVNFVAATSVASKAAVSYILGGKTVIATSNGGVTATPAYTATPALTTNAGATSITGQSAYIAESAAHAAGGSYASGGISTAFTGTTTNNSLLAVVSLRPATTTMANGTVGTSATVLPGAADQKIDGFSFVTGSAGTTDSITGLTVTSTNQAAIASMRIMNEAGTTQYFGIVNNPGSNSWAFSGGTPIPVTNTVSNYKIYVTYKSRAGGAPSGLTTTTANVTAYTGSNIAAGTDTADTTLTLSNVHAASTWGSCDAADNTVTLNWSYGTAGQSVIVIRYTANSDTTKPADGTTYINNNPFGTGGTIRYIGTASTLIDSVGITNGTTYYYKIFEYDAYKYYYNASDVWTAALTPQTSDPNPPVVDPGFTATTPVNSVNIPITSYGASDIGTGVAGYLITTSSTPPSAAAAGWTSTPPGSFTVGGQASYTLYPWAKDGGGNVSALYTDTGPVNVIVDLTKPIVTAVTGFTVPTQSASLDIPITNFVATDAGGSSMAAYMITTNNTPPAFDAEGWTVTAPTTFTVPSDTSYQLYPWAKDGAGNVSLVYATPRTVLVDTTAPVGLSLNLPDGEAVNLPLATTLSCTTATDSGTGGVMYQFQINSVEPVYSENSGWQSGTSYAPTGLVKGVQYSWSVKAKDAIGNETLYTDTRSFSIIAPCVRNNPTLTLLTAGGGIATTIAADSGTSTYKLRLINNDTGDCGSSTFNLSTIDDFFPDSTHFLDSVFVETGNRNHSIALNPGSEVTKDLRVSAAPDVDNGVAKTTVKTAADIGAGHAEYITSFVQTTINVVTCKPQIPLLIVGPDSGYLNRAGNMVYTITLKNTDAGAGCTPVTYTLSIPSESNSTDYNASQLSTVTLVLNSGELKSASLTVSARSTAAKAAVNNTAIHVAAGGHTSPADITVKSTVNNPMLHNSDNTSSTKWSVTGWGIPNGRYGEIVCSTCHVGGGGDTLNIKRVNEKVFTPFTTGGLPHFPGEGKSFAYRRYIGDTSSKPVFGWDAGATPRNNPATTRICEACHTYDATKANGTKAHPYTTGATLGNHFNTDGTDCTRCHKHNQGFGGVSNMLCNKCHGDENETNITAANRYVVAPPKSATGKTGTLTGTGQVSNDPKVGAHQTHLQFTNGFSNYSTVDFRCENCHGTLAVSGSPTQFDHANGSSTPAFQGLANNRNARTPSFSSINLTCSNTYCHNPAGTGGSLAAANAGLAILPSWTSASYLTDSVRKSQTNCNRCHKVPGDAGFSYQGSHGSMVTDQTTDCSGCHGHNGDAAGSVGRRHIDGIRFALSGHIYSYRGSVHMSAAGAFPYTGCTGCHTNGSNTTYPPIPARTAPDCTGCHLLGLKNPSGTFSCYDCHGVSATDGWPNGNAFPNISGSHTAHKSIAGVTCNYCHTGGGTGTAKHGSYSSVARVKADVKVVLGAQAGTAATWTASTLTCGTSICHGQKSPAWGAAVPSRQCQYCHGSQTLAYTGYTQASIAPGTGNLDTNRTTGVTVRGGMHQEHLQGIMGMSRKVRCEECHITVTSVSQPSHLNYTTATVNFSGVATAQTHSAATVTRISGIINCSTTECHTGVTNTGSAMTPAWNNSSYLTGTGGSGTLVLSDCKQCHALPPNPGSGSHAGLVAVTGFPISAQCGSNCHTNIVTSATTYATIFVNKSEHIDGIAQAGTCLSCHAGVAGTGAMKRAPVVGQFASQSHHIQKAGGVTNADCFICHGEADSSGATTASHGGSSNPGSAVNLVIHQTGSRGTTYVAYTANSANAVEATRLNRNRTQMAKITTHCLSCHNAANVAYQPFAPGDTRTPIAYAWDGKSAGEKYIQTLTYAWGKFNFSGGTTPVGGTNAKNAVIKALSAHGNAANNDMGGPVQTDTAITDISGSVNVLCYDCHNSHGSAVAGITSQYSSSTGRNKGGLIKDIVANTGGYKNEYRPAQHTASGSEHNTFNPGATLCFDCHANRTAGTVLLGGYTSSHRAPWGYNSTFGASQPLNGYYDTPYFGNYTAPSAKRTVYKRGTANAKAKPMGGHYGVTSALTTTLTKQAFTTTVSAGINGLCTPCHDPHGVSTNAAYVATPANAVPLLKGTWVTSPYKEDKADIGVQRGGGSKWGGLTAGGAIPGYHIDQNTLVVQPNPTGSGGATTASAVNANRGQKFAAFATSANGQQTIVDLNFAGLCTQCHAKANLTNATAPSTTNWQTTPRIHQSVKGWAATTGTNTGNAVHAYTCSKCHAPHTSRLPRLMVTNCLDVNHFKQVASGGTIPATAAAGAQVAGYLNKPVTSGGVGRFPAGGVLNAGPYTTNKNAGPWWFETAAQGSAATYGSNCHNATNAGGTAYNPTNQRWNTKTPW